MRNTFLVFLFLLLAMALLAEVVYCDALLKAAENGSAKAQSDLGLCYLNGLGVAQDTYVALKWFEKAVLKGDMEAQYQLALLTNQIFLPNGNPQKAAELLLLAAKQGHPEAQHELAVYYLFGEGVSKDPKEYVKWMKLSAENGNTRAQSSLGDEYLNGGYVEQDHTEAVKWLKLAANKGDEDAQRNLGDCYMFGYGVPQSHVEAFKLYAPLAEKGNHTLSLNMGNAYEFGDGVKQDYEQAYKWYLLAANNSQDDYMAYNYNITLVQKMKAKLSVSQKAKIDAEVARLQESIDLLKKEDSNDLLFEDDY